MSVFQSKNNKIHGIKNILKFYFSEVQQPDQ